MRLLKRLNEDESLAQFRGQFVPLKITASNRDPEWKKWRAQYQHEGKGVPILFVIRPDGEQLYGRSGALPGDGLRNLLASGASASGRIITPDEVDLLTDCCQKSSAALDRDEFLVAAAAMQPAASKFGELGSIPSYAESVIQANTLAATLTELASKRIEQYSAPGSAPSQSLERLASLYEIDKLFKGFPTVRQQTRNVLKQIKADDTRSKLMKPAFLIAKARLLAASDRERDHKRAESAYTKIIDSNPDSPAASVATAELTKLNPNADVLQMRITNKEDSDSSATPDSQSKATIDSEEEAQVVTPVETLRTWSDESGNFSVQAKLVSVAGNKITLEKPSGVQIVVNKTQLSAADIKYLDQTPQE